MGDSNVAGSGTAGLVPVRRALLSVSDKAGLADFAGALHREFGVELISTGGTAKFLREAGLPVTDVADVTGFPEMMDGRVKTLHPKVHGGLLALRDNAEHVASMTAHGIRPIDLVCINLYPFQQTIEKPGVTFDEAIENIDIGGPSMVRSAAKNHAWVVVVTSPERYETVLGDLRKHGGRSCGKLRLKQSQAAFAHTAEYDGRIADYLDVRVTPVASRERQDTPTGGPAVHVVGVRSGAVATATTRFPGNDDVAGASTAVEADVRAAADRANSTDDFFAVLLDASMAATAGTEACVFTVGKGWWVELAAFRRSQWPTFVGSPVHTKSLVPLAEDALRSDASLAVQLGGADLYPPGPPVYGLVTHLRSDGRTKALLVVIARCQNETVAGSRSRALQMMAREYGRFEARRAASPAGVEGGSRSAPMATAAGPAAGPLTDRLSLDLTKKQDLRYGENPHQRAALYVAGKPREASVAFAKQHHGKALSYINLLDADGALACVTEFASPAACIVKHTTPCGCAAADDIATAFHRAYAGDPLAAFGGIVALNKPVDLAAAEAITSIDKLLEVIVAPYYADDALELLRSRWKNVRLLEVGPVVQGDEKSPARRDAGEVSLHKIVGGYLVQERDLLGLDESTWRVASKRQPTAVEMADLRFAWLVCKHVKSNAIAVCKDRMLLGAGAGQMDRPSAARLAVGKAGDRISGAVAASDAFFPFPDGPKLLLDAGVRAIIHPGGSLKDQDTVDLIDSRDGALVLTGQRHFKH